MELVIMGHRSYTRGSGRTLNWASEVARYWIDRLPRELTGDSHHFPKSIFEDECRRWDTTLTFDEVFPKIVEHFAGEWVVEEQGADVVFTRRS